MCSGSSNQLLLPRMSFGAAANRALQLTSQLSPTQPFPFVPLLPLPLPPPPPAESALVVLPSSSIMQFQSQQGEAWSLLHVCSRKHCEYIILPAKLKKIIIKPVNIIAQDFTGGTTETPGVKPALLKINPQASNSEKKTKLFQSRHWNKNFTCTSKKPMPSLEDDGPLLLKGAAYPRAAAVVCTWPWITGSRTERSPNDPPQMGNQWI